MAEKRRENLDTDQVEPTNTEVPPAKKHKMSLSPFKNFDDANIHSIEVDVPKWVSIRETTTITIKARDCYLQESAITVQVQQKTGDDIVVLVQDNQDGTYTASFVANQIGEIKLSVCIDDKNIKEGPYIVPVVRQYSALDKPNKIIKDDERINNPMGVTFGNDGLWAMMHSGAYNCVCIFDDKDQLVRSFGSYGNENGQFKFPSGLVGLAFDTCNHLYVTESCNHRVQKFDINGRYLLQFGKHGSGNGELANPIGITVHNKKVLVADQENGRISVFHHDGCFSHTFGSDHLRNPWDVLVTDNNRILVADRGLFCISIFTIDGTYVSKIGGIKGSGRGQLHRPCSLAVDLHGFIFVSDYTNHRVTVFDKDGIFVHCFGSCGSDDGQFSGPYSIACSPNGSVYVSDYNNKRIQIFF